MERTDAETTSPPFSSEIQTSMSCDSLVSNAPKLVTVALPLGSKIRSSGVDVGSWEVDCNVSSEGGVHEESTLSRLFGSYSTVANGCDEAAEEPRISYDNCTDFGYDFEEVVC